MYTVLNVLDYYPLSCFYLKQRFRDWTLPPSSGEKPTNLAPIDNSPYLRAPELLKGRLREGLISLCRYKENNKVRD
jgi:hypothetical protein